MKPSRHQFTVLKQIVELVPPNLVPKLARKHGLDKQSRKFSPWSHVNSMLFAQLSHALSLNDVCDTLRNHSGSLSTMREAQPPSRNGLSHANRTRGADMAEELFWQTLDNLQKQAPDFGMGRNYVGFPRRFKRAVNVVDSTTILPCRQLHGLGQAPGPESRREISYEAGLADFPPSVRHRQGG